VCTVEEKDEVTGLLGFPDSKSGRKPLTHSRPGLRGQDAIMKVDHPGGQSIRWICGGVVLGVRSDHPSVQ
jgi:hypothetical protein